MKEIQLPYKISSNLLINKISELEWGDLFLSIEGNEKEIKGYLLSGKLHEYFSDEYIQRISEIINELKTIKENLLWHPEELISEGSINIINFSIFNSFSLSEVLKKSQSDVVPLTIDLVLSIFSKVLQALNIIHEHRIYENRLVHGMPIPSHIFISLDGEVKLMHPGIFSACLLEKKLPLELKERLEIYLAPEQKEQFSGSKYSDIYSAGVALLETLVNKSLKEFHYSNIYEFIDEAKAYSPSSDLIELPIELKKILKKALSPEANKRYSSAEEFEEELDEYLFSGEYQPSTFNLAFYMSTLLRSEAEAFNKLIEETKKLNLLSYFQKKEEKEKIEILLPEETKEIEEIIELEESPTIQESVATKEFIKEEKIIGISKPERAPITSFEIPEKKSLWKPAILALIVVIMAGLATYFIFNGGLSQKSVAVVPKSQTIDEKALKLEQQKRKELEEKIKKFQEEQKEYLKEIQELQRLLEEKKSDEEKKAIIQKIEELGVKQKQKEEKFSKEIKDLSPAEGEKSTEEETKPKEEVPNIKEEGVYNKGPKIAEAPVIPSEIKPPEVENKSEEIQENKPKPSENASLNIETKPPIEESKISQAPEKEIYDKTELDEPIKVIKEPKVEYPVLAKRRGIEGMVLLQLIINKDGKVESVKVIRGAPELIDAAVEAAKNTIYTKPKKNGVFVKVRITKVYNFKM